MKIRMYNVGFGDCFLLSQNHQHLLVDFGSDTHKNFKEIAQNLLDECKEDTVSVLLSHFHLDHLNGIIATDCLEKLNIDKVYLPDLFQMKKSGNRLNYFQIVMLEDIFRNVFLSHRPKISMYELLLKMMKANTVVEFVQCGHHFEFAKETYEVLWPNFNLLNINERSEKAIIKCLVDLNLISQEQLNRKDSIKIPIIDDMIEHLLDGFSSLTQNHSPAYLEQEHSYDFIFNQYQKDLDDLLEKHHEIYKKEKMIHARLNSIAKLGNEISIVFQDVAQHDISKVLMCGDVTKTHYLKMRGIAKKVSVIKAAHHGTDTHFVECLPDHDRMLISNGEPAGWHRHYGKIAFQYGLYMNDDKPLICSNSRCLLKEGSYTHQCKQCSGEANKEQLYTEITLKKTQ